MIKPTKRKAFNFLRSYFDVLNELNTDKDKLNFLLSVINKQFLDENPENLNFVVNLCYESQRHQIEQSVKGWKRATNDTLGTTPPTPLGTTPPTDPKEVEEKGEEEEKVKEQSYEQKKTAFIDWFNKSKLKYKNKVGKTKVINSKDENNLKRLFENYEFTDFEIAIKNLYKSKWAEDNNMQTISHFIRLENFNKYLEQGDTASAHQSINSQPAN